MKASNQVEHSGISEWFEDLWFQKAYYFFLKVVLKDGFQERIWREEAGAIMSHTRFEQLFPVGSKKVLVNVNLAGGAEGAVRAAEGLLSGVSEHMTVNVVFFDRAVSTHVAYVGPLQLPCPVILAPLLREASSVLEEKKKTTIGYSLFLERRHLQIVLIACDFFIVFF